MQIKSNTSFDSFTATRASTQVSRGNGDNESFARLMQQRRDQAVPAPQPVPRQPAADTSSSTYDMTRKAAAADSAKTADSSGKADSDDIVHGGNGPTAPGPNGAQARPSITRKAGATVADKTTDKAKADAASTTDPVKTGDDLPGSTPADWMAQWAGVAPKQAPITEPSDGDAGAGTATDNDVAGSLPPRLPIGAATDPATMIGGANGKQPTIGIISPNDPRSPVESTLSPDDNPISLTPTADVGGADKAGATPAADEASTLAALQASALLTIDNEKNDKASTTDPVGNLDSTGAAAAASGVAPAATHTAEPTSVKIDTPIHAPEFKEALGVQISLLAKDGVQHAQLHLNPVDMGPISVQIATEGTQARVDFGADSAATRQILEAGLPELASALRDAGMTLTGGGVSQNANGGSQGSDTRDGSRASRRMSFGSDAEHGPIATPTRTQRGALDLYA